MMSSEIKISKSEIASSRSYFLSTLFLSILTIYFSGLFVGKSDSVSFFIFLIVTSLLTIMIYQLRRDSRSAMAIYFKRGSLFHDFFIRKDFSFTNLIISILVAAPLSFLFILMSKGLILNHELWQVVVAVFFASLIYLFMVKNFYSQTSDVVEINVAEDAQKNTFNILSVFVISVVINIFISLYFSIPDYLKFSENDTVFDMGFFDKINQIKQESFESNSLDPEAISGKIAIIYLMFDEIKIIIANEIFSIFGSLDAKRDVEYWLVFIGYAFMLNMIKLFGFSMTFVLLLTVYSNYISSKLTIFAVQSGNLSKRKLVFFYGLLKVFYLNASNFCKNSLLKLREKIK